MHHGTDVTNMRSCGKSWTMVRQLPLTFDEWEKNAESERAVAKREGVSIIPVLFAPDEFFAFCREKKISPNRATAAAFAGSRGAASCSMGL